MSTTTLQPLSLQVNRLIKAPRERVFAAWTQPAEIVKWFGNDTCRLESARIDLRVGGEYQLHVKGSECGSKAVYGVYREIKSPSRLVFTWNSSGSAQENVETLVTIDFVESNGATDVRISHENFTSEESRDRHNQGWNGCLDNLAKLA